MADDPWAEFRAKPAASAADPWAEFRGAPAAMPTGPQGFMANAADFVKSIPRGALSGLSSALSASGQAEQLQMGQPVDVPSAQDTTKILEQNVTGQLHEPQGRAGKVGAAIGETIGNPASYVGPGGLGLKLGGAALSGAGGEVARQTAEGTKYEIPAQIAGSLAGGVVGAKTLGPAAERAVAPTYHELKTAANADYQAARNSGLELHPQGVAQFAAKAEQDITGANHGFTGGQYGDAPKTLAVLDTLQKPPHGAVVTASNIDAVRKNLGRLSRETLEGKPTPDAAAASVALEHLNDYTQNIPTNHILAGDAAEYLRATKQGNANYAAAQRVRNFDSKITKAENNAAGGIATSLENQIKSQSRTILNNPKAQRGWSADELASLQRLNNGTLGSNILRQAGRGGAGVIPIMGHVGLAAGSGGATLPLQAAIAATLYGARKGSEAITKSRAMDLAEMLAKRSPEYQSRASRVPHTSNAPHIAAIARALATGAVR